VLTVGFLIWLYLARNEAYYFVRNMFMVAMGIALVGYVVYPTAPPRFMPEWGFQDTVTEWVGLQAANNANALYNPFAAVPSMHVAFALMIAVPALYVIRNRVIRAFFAVYPVLVTVTVVVTGNHWWFDAFLGALVAGVSALAASGALARARPDAWAFRTGLREAPV
jgi:membrane-associated phospholipid phosphatase